MKGRSQRLATAAATVPAVDDWVNGAWTVDCSCGVNFDDGEEMVSCDECGVWVHTRCSRYVPDENSSFVCHKCSRRPRCFPDDEAEETEVAQLLVELPTKASNPPPPPPAFTRRPFRLWTELPMHERVHVAGVPTGDSSIFAGVSPVFSPQLWKCAGYVPKKFSFKYREFPCWDDEEEGKKGKDEEESENPASRGADLLFSLSKESVPPLPFRSFERQFSPEFEKKKDLGTGLFGTRLQSTAKKERSKHRALAVQSSKRSRHDGREEKYASVKKKARSAHDRSGSVEWKKGSVPVVDLNRVDICEGSFARDGDVTMQDGKSTSKHESVPSECKITNQDGLDSSRKTKNIVVVNSSRSSSSDKTSRQKGRDETAFQTMRYDNLGSTLTERPINVNVSASSLGKDNDDTNVTQKEEDLQKSEDRDHHYEAERTGHYPSSADSDDSKIASGVLPKSCNTTTDASANRITTTITSSTRLDKTKVKLEGEDNKQLMQKPPLESCILSGKKLLETDNSSQNVLSSADNTDSHVPLHENSKSLPAYENKLQNIQDGFMSVHKVSETNKEEVHPKSSTIEASCGSMSVEKPLDVIIEGEAAVGSNDGLSLSSKCESGLGTEKASLSVKDHVVTKPSSVTCSTPEAVELSTSSKGSDLQQQGKEALETVERKDNLQVAVASQENHELISSLVQEELHKCAVRAAVKPSESSSIPCALTCDSKSPVPNSNQVGMLSSTTASSSENSATVSGCGEVSTSSVQMKQKSSSTSNKCERHNPPIPQPATRLSHSVTSHSSASANANLKLSDEELALLLHQELNSSPRVPRVPRIRQAAGQMVPSTGSSFLSKRSSGSGAKDHTSVLKRKGRDDGSRDSSRNNREVIGETKRIGKLNSSHDHKHEDLVLSADASKTDAQNRSSDNLAYVKKNVPVASTAGARSPSLEVNGQKVSSSASSNKGVSDGNSGFASRTLPGLIGMIIGKRRDISLDEICDAVRPHWHNLRKPNGERYAYSSHSQAVLDCLRNRSEWAHLIGRGPKTNLSKRRKLDGETPLSDSENEEARSKVSKRVYNNNESHHEDFPKGKRRARKRKSLEVNGQFVKDRKIHKCSHSDDDSTKIFNSSDEAKEACSGDESQESELHSEAAGVSSPVTDEA